MTAQCKRYAFASPDSGVTVEMTLSIEDGAKFGRGEPWGPLPVTDLVTGQVLWVRGAACSAGPRCFCAAEIVDEPVTGGSEVVRLVDEPVTGAPIPPPEDDSVMLLSCECDNTHEAEDTVCRWCWGHGRRKWADPDVPDDAGPIETHN